jgi:hypothetical protein
MTQTRSSAKYPKGFLRPEKVLYGQRLLKRKNYPSRRIVQRLALFFARKFSQAQSQTGSL